jgi:hypothetical protein
MELTPHEQIVPIRVFRLMVDDKSPYHSLTLLVELNASGFLLF